MLTNSEMGGKRKPAVKKDSGDAKPPAKTAKLVDEDTTSSGRGTDATKSKDNESIAAKTRTALKRGAKKDVPAVEEQSMLSFFC